MASTSNATPGAASSGTPDPHAKKGPTPSRREREQANFRPLVPADRKAAKKEAQAKMRAAQTEAREGAMRGEDKYLRPTERGPQKRFMRDVVDSRFSLGELLIPMMLLIVFTNFLGDNTIALFAMIFIWVFLIVAAIEAWFVGRSIRTRIGAVVGADRVESGIITGTLARALQLRFMRMPKPQVKRWSKPEFTGR